MDFSKVPNMIQMFIIAWFVCFNLLISEFRRISNSRTSCGLLRFAKHFIPAWFLWLLFCLFSSAVTSKQWFVFLRLINTISGRWVDLVCSIGLLRIWERNHFRLTSFSIHFLEFAWWRLTQSSVPFNWWQFTWHFQKL